MKLLTLAKFILILIVPFLIALVVLQSVAFSNSFYNEEFSKYNVQQNVPDALPLHERVMNFLKGNTNELPDSFNEREKEHFWDVRGASQFLSILMYSLIIIFIILLLASSFALKVNNFIVNFAGKVLVFGGILTLVLAAVLFFLINSDFSSGFESFHKLFFTGGTYTFDPAKEIIVRLYPQQLFQDLGIKISGWVIAISILIIFIGTYFLFRTKKKKIK